MTKLLFLLLLLTYVVCSRGSLVKKNFLGGGCQDVYLMNAKACDKKFDEIDKFCHNVYFSLRDLCVNKSKVVCDLYFVKHKISCEEKQEAYWSVCGQIYKAIENECPTLKEIKEQDIFVDGKVDLSKF